MFSAVQRLSVAVAALPTAVALAIVAFAAPACKATDSHGSDASASQEAGAPSAEAGSSEWRSMLPEIEVSCGDNDSTRLYEQRIEPLFKEDRPSSCNECHLSGLDLQVFMRDTPCETMACLISLGMVDAEDPEDSTVLDWIARANPQSPLITQQIIAEEYQGFREWIHYSTQCDECATAICPSSGDGGAFCPNEREPVIGYDPAEFDPGGCDDAALLSVFRDTIYASRGRCSPCHMNDHEFEVYKAPTWLDVQGDCESASRQTYWNILDRGYVDVEDPAQSLIILKPLAKSLGGIKHGGHDKFWSLTKDQGYLNFMYFLERYATCNGYVASDADSGTLSGNDSGAP